MNLAEPLPDLEHDPHRPRVVLLAIIVLPLVSALCSVAVLVAVLMLLS